MTLYNYFKYILTGMLICMVASCDLEETNVNPDNPEEAPNRVLLSSAQAGFAYALGGDMGRYANVITQHLAGVGRQHLVIGRNQITENDVNNAWRFNLYPIMQNLKVVIQQAQEEGSPHFSGAAKVMLASVLGVTTDAWGDIPYTNAFQGREEFNPTYDPQEVIYDTIQALLDEAIVELQASESLNTLESEDLIYGGNLNNWIKAAYTLKARYYNHLSQVNPTESAQMALAALDSGFTSNAENMTLAFGGTQTEANPYYQFNQQRGDIVMAEFFTDLLIDRDDPRLDEYVTPLKGNFAGATSGEPETGSDMGPFVASIDSPVPFITYPEAQFIRAEALLRLNQGGEAAEAYNEAVKASLREVTGSDDYPDFIAQYASASGSVTLEQIMTQKYITMFGTFETWVDIRRTGFPDTPDPVMALGPEPLRFPYPQSERTFNAANVPDVTLTTPLYWDR
ncbi:SusD/RagB family nutrient-binding outer membrane lipoprotein [Pontibacter anaerobius]|uniref:SusD/RagB family nutrient-binding outer membrane lipoprotein n=1 Tax=Pontibacter anaerobius TaxID=2993940 RepID=A0ABT3RCN8_9BACT|nr:SusD/RagB family nutrient-binding outer membrane lipoprotein [Pontibacter anaerobius]MCX2739622.1 SusD/RagB family nutrient-binding outer membrane lipoprotein [Pontibacter anaerobius]